MARTLLTSSIPEILAAGLRWADEPAENGRLEMYHAPVRGRLYGAGSDHAHGLEDGDWDVLCIFDKTDQIEGRKPRQVFEAQGHWGPRFHKVLYVVLRLFNNAFLMPEQQGGGDFAAKTLWDEYGYRRIYRHGTPTQQRDEKPDNARLGWPAQASDVVVAQFRNDVADQAMVINSSATLKQMGNVQWKSRTVDPANRAEDTSLRMHLPGGGSPDLTRAAAYGWYALREMMNQMPAEAPATFHPSMDQPDRPESDTRDTKRRLGSWKR